MAPGPTTSVPGSLYQPGMCSPLQPCQAGSKELEEGVWEVCLVVEKCPSPVNLFHLPQSSRTPFSMLKEGSLWSPHVVEARVATLCWQSLPTWDPRPSPWGTAVPLKQPPDPWLAPFHPSMHHCLVITDLLTSHQQLLLPWSTSPTPWPSRLS